MKRATQLEHRASSRLGKHEGEPSLGLCDRLDRTRDNSQRQLPTDHDYAVPTREYQTDQSSLKPAQAAARSVLGKKQKQRQRQKQPHRLRRVDRVTPYQANALIGKLKHSPRGSKTKFFRVQFSDLHVSKEDLVEIWCDHSKASSSKRNASLMNTRDTGPLLTSLPSDNSTRTADVDPRFDSLSRAYNIVVRCPMRR